MDKVLILAALIIGVFIVGVKIAEHRKASHFANDIHEFIKKNLDKEW